MFWERRRRINREEYKWGTNGGKREDRRHPPSLPSRARSVPKLYRTKNIPCSKLHGRKKNVDTKEKKRTSFQDFRCGSRFFSPPPLKLSATSSPAPRGATAKKRCLRTGQREREHKRGGRSNAGSERCGVAAGGDVLRLVRCRCRCRHRGVRRKARLPPLLVRA